MIRLDNSGTNLSREVGWGDENEKLWRIFTFSARLAHSIYHTYVYYIKLSTYSVYFIIYCIFDV